MRRKGEIDQKVAVYLGMSKRKVSLITSLFLVYLRTMLVRDGEVIIDGLGKFNVVRHRLSNGVEGSGKHQLRVHFTKSKPLREALAKADRR